MALLRAIGAPKSARCARSVFVRSLYVTVPKRAQKNGLGGPFSDDSKLLTAQAFKDVIEDRHSRILHAAEQSNNAQEADREVSELYDLCRRLSAKLDEASHVTADEKASILSLVVERFAQHNFGVSTLALSALGNDLSKLSPAAAVKLVEHNPGRVSSSFHLYRDLCDKVGHSDELAAATLAKLAFGDKVEIKEGLHEITVDKLVQILQVCAQMGGMDAVAPKVQMAIVRACSRLEVSALIPQLNLSAAVLERLIKEDDTLKGIDYLYMYQAAVESGVSLSGNAIVRIFMPISRLLQRDTLQESENLKSLKSRVEFTVPELGSPADIVAELREQIQELELDDTFQVKLDMVKSAAFYSKDFAKAIYYFQHYQPRIAEGTDAQNSLKSTMSLAAVFECILKNDTKMVALAESLVPQTPLPAPNNLAALVLFHGWFGDSDRAFDIYNQALDLYMVPLEGNEAQRGVLIQALATVSLLGREVGLAQLIKQKSMENKLINDEWEARLTNLLKDYGDVIEDAGSDETKFRAAFQTLILNQIVSIVPS